jgi:hypothetical protein
MTNTEAFVVARAWRDGGLVRRELINELVEHLESAPAREAKRATLVQELQAKAADNQERIDHLGVTLELSRAENQRLRAENERLRAAIHRQPKGYLVKDGKPVVLSTADQALVEAIWAPDDETDDALEIPITTPLDRGGPFG